MALYGAVLRGARAGCRKKNCRSVYQDLRVLCLKITGASVPTTGEKCHVLSFLLLPDSLLGAACLASDGSDAAAAIISSHTRGAAVGSLESK